MTVLVERLKIAAQEAQRVNALPNPKGDHPIKVNLQVEPRGVLVSGHKGSVAHRYVVPFEEIESGLNNSVVIQIGHAVEILSA